MGSSKEMKKAIKLAISSSGDTVESTVDPRFGRSKYFMLYDGASEEYTTLVNAARGAGGGAGVQAAETVIQSGASVVLTGNVGPKAFQVLSSADVLVVTEVTGTVKEAVGKFLSGEYPAADTSNVSARIG
jgi:predicted Fe-Mo cluster-binding NifX family protein